MGWWQDRVVPRLTDGPLSRPEVMELRARACAGLAGRVLEIGYGSGLNTDVYPGAVTAVDAVEPSDLGWERSGPRRGDTAVPVRRVGLDGQRLDAEEASYDAVLCTFTLCTVPDAERVVREVRRVLRPGGALHLLEHTRAPDAGVVAWQRRLDPVQRRAFGGCHLTREPVALADRAGLEVEVVSQDYLPGPGLMRPWTFVTVARAVRP